MSKRRVYRPGVSFFAFQDIITAVVGIFILITLILVLELVERVEAASAQPTANIESVLESIAVLSDEVQRMSAEVDRRSAAQAEAAEINEFNRQEKKERAQARIAEAERRLAMLQTKTSRTQSQLESAEQEAVALAERSVELEDDRRLLDQLKQQLGSMRDQVDRLRSDESPVFRDVTEEGRYVTLVILQDSTINLRDSLSQSTELFRGSRRLDLMRDWLNQNELSRRQLFIVAKPGSAEDFRALQALLDRSDAIYGYNVAGADETIRLGFESP